MIIIFYTHGNWRLKNQRSFVSTFLKRKEKAITHSYLKTKPNKDAHQITCFGPRPLNDLLSSRSLGVSLQTSKRLADHQKERGSDLHFKFHFLPIQGNILPVRSGVHGLVWFQPWPTHQELVPGPFISSFEGPRGGRMQWYASSEYKPSSEMRNTPAWRHKSEKLPNIITSRYGGMLDELSILDHSSEQNWKMKTGEGKSFASAGEA